MRSVDDVLVHAVGVELVAVLTERFAVVGEIAVIDPSIGRVINRFGGFESPTELAMLESGLIAVGQDRVSRVDLVAPNSGVAVSPLQTCGATSAADRWSGPRASSAAGSGGDASGRFR